MSGWIHARLLLWLHGEEERGAAVLLRMTELVSAAMVSGRVAAVMGMAAGGTGGSSRGRGCDGGQYRSQRGRFPST